MAKEVDFSLNSAPKKPKKKLKKETVDSVIVKAWPEKYLKHKPTPLQLGFCIHPAETVLTGGSAGGGKSDALLMAALQYVEYSEYKAIIYRRTFADLSKPGALLDRIKDMDWLGPWLRHDVKYDPATHTFHFPSGAQVSFGYMGKAGSTESAQGSEYHFVGVDEVTQHTEKDVKWMCSRLRRTKDSRIPLRIRLTANPGGRGHEWVKKMFGIKKNPKFDPKKGKTVAGHFFSEEPMFIGTSKKNIFIPARVIDNPFLDQANYIDQLKNLDDVTRKQLLDGDWDSSPSARFKEDWFPSYTRRGEYYCYGGTDVLPSSMYRFQTVDVAASTRDGVGNSDTGLHVKGAGGREMEPCWTVISTWGIGANFLFLLDVERGQIEAPDIFTMMAKNFRKWNVSCVYVEANGVGRPVAQFASSRGIPVQEIWAYTDKITNSILAQSMAKEGRVLLPSDRQADWIKNFCEEVFTWTGSTEDVNDQVDTFSTAAKVAQSRVLPTFDITNKEKLMPKIAIPNNPFTNLKAHPTNPFLGYR